MPPRPPPSMSPPSVAPPPRRILPSLDVALLRLRDISPAFRALDASSWLLFLAIYARLKSDGDVTSPTQDELEGITSLATRTIRNVLRPLIEAELLCIGHVRAKGGGLRIRYQLGAVAHVALDELRTRPTARTVLRGAEARLADVERRVAKLEVRRTP